MTAALVLLGGYLLGSMPFGYWPVRLPRARTSGTVGSGNIGASERLARLRTLVRAP